LKKRRNNARRTQESQILRFMMLNDLNTDDVGVGTTKELYALDVDGLRSNETDEIERRGIVWI
jgi:hypothetical protein